MVAARGGIPGGLLLFSPATLAAGAFPEAWNSACVEGLILRHHFISIVVARQNMTFLTGMALLLHQERVMPWLMAYLHL